MALFNFFSILCFLQLIFNIELMFYQSLTYQVLQAITYCHCRRILHRDLKPQNLLMGSNGIIKVADFGLARAVGLPIRMYTHEVVFLILFNYILN